jgi:hypothetical protein
MNQEENRGQEPASSPNPAPSAAQNPVSTPAPRITESKLESAHAGLPPLSVIGASAEPVAKPGTIATPKQFGRRGVPSNVAPAGKTENARPSIGVVENPALAKESISGELAHQPAAAQAPRAPRAEFRPERRAESHHEPRPERTHESRGPREPRGERFERPHHAPQHAHQGHEQGRNPERTPREPRSERPRLQIDPVVIPVQTPIGFWANLKRKLTALFGISTKASAGSRAHHPRGEHRQHRGDFRQGGHRPRGGQGRGRGGPGGRPDFRRSQGDRRSGPREG